MTTERERIDFDVLFVGGGPACLAGAIRLMQMAKEQGKELEVALIEKGAEIGAHAVSGAILDPSALAELLPEHLEAGCPVDSVVRGDAFVYLTKTRHFRIPVVPRFMHNAGNYIVSLSRLVRWMGEIAEEMDVNIFPGFAGTEILFGEDGRTVTGIRTGDKGLDKDGRPKGNFEPGIDLMAKVVILGEGARGSLMGQAAAGLGLFENRMPQVFEVGVKEVIELPEPGFFADRPYNDIHLMGHPLGLDTPGGGFIYEMAENRIALGFLTALCYENPRLDPYDEFLRFKRHPFVADIIRGGKVVEQGARTVSTGGYFTMPELAVDGAMAVGGAAAMHNTPGLKGIHIAMKSGMLAAETAFEAIAAGKTDAETLAEYPRRFEESRVRAEMYEGRNFAQALAKKGLAKLIHLGAQYVTGGRGIRDCLPTEPDAGTLRPLEKTPLRPATDPEHFDGTLLVDKLTGVYLSRTVHREDQPSHILVHDTDLCVRVCFPTYGSPCTVFCPGKVYEMVETEAGSRELRLNPSNCLHCKTCDIKDPYGNIAWTCPEGGEGPGYAMV